MGCKLYDQDNGACLLKVGMSIEKSRELIASMAVVTPNADHDAAREQAMLEYERNNLARCYIHLATEINRLRSLAITDTTRKNLGAEPK